MSNTAVMPPVSVEDIARRSNVAAMLGLRWAGTIIDWVVLCLFLLIPDWYFGNETYQATLAVWLGAIALYYPVTEGIWGRTAGKLLTGIVVVDENGRPPGFGKAILRTLARLLEVNPIFLGGIPAGIVFLCSKTRQRGGDFWAKTYVLRTSELRKFLGP